MNKRNNMKQKSLIVTLRLKPESIKRIKDAIQGLPEEVAKIIEKDMLDELTEDDYLVDGEIKCR